MTRLFITGATGYIGGEILYGLSNAYPDLEITAIVRTPDKGAKVAAQYAKVKLVYGDLDSTDLLAAEAEKADIIVHTADCDHEASVKAIIAGLGRKPGDSKSYLIHTSGSGILSWQDFETKVYGAKSEKVYNDWDGIKEVTSLPDTALHRNVDKIVLAAGEQYKGKVHTAIVCPPCIYGLGRGPDNQHSVQAYRLASATLKRGKGFQVGEGVNTWTQIHVQDLSNVFLALVEAASSPNGGKATWNEEGYYFAENGDFQWGDISRGIAKAAKEKGLIESADIDNIPPEEADKLAPSGSYLWGTNSRCRSIRANKLFGWTPKQKSLPELLLRIVEVEAEREGLIKTHAEKAAGLG